jgi:hypothetical protein
MRNYELNGRSLPSVTTILDATMSDEQRVMLDQFYANNKQSHLINAESQRRGNQVDEWAKAYLSYRPLPEIDHQFSPYCRHLQPILDRLLTDADVVLTDHFVHTDTYAGTLDAAIVAGGSVLVLDVKTRRFLFPQALEKAMIQTTAYKEAMESMGAVVRSIAVVTVTKRKVNYVEVNDPLELVRLSQQWRSRLAQYLGVSDAAL